MSAYTFMPRTYSILDNKAYGRVRSYFKNHSFEIQEKFENYLYNALSRAIEHSDPSHLSDAIFAARELNQYRSVYRVLHSLDLPWHWTDIETPKGDVPKANKKKLAFLRINWQMSFAQAMDKEEVHTQEKPVWDWAKKQAVLLRLVKQAKEHGVSMEAIEETLKKAA